MAERITPSEIASHAASLRRLARYLVRDAADADDAVQETLVAALRSPPDRGPTVSAWLAAVLRNSVRKSWRGRARRAAREQDRPAPAVPARPEERLERSELAGTLVRAIRRLSPEKRVVVELRYFEGVMPRRIAARLGLPVETVKSRLKRALADLRANLTERHGPSWPADFVLAFGGALRWRTPRIPRLAVPLAESLIAMKTSTIVIAAVLLLAGLLAGVATWSFTAGQPSSSPEPAFPDLARDAEARDAAGEDAGAHEPNGGGDPAAPDDGSSADEGGAGKVRGRVVLLDEEDGATPVPAGSLHLTDWHEVRPGTGIGETRIEAFHGGRFEFDRSAGHRIEFVTVVIGDRPAIVVDPPDPERVNAGLPVVVKVRIARDTVIRVLDAATGEELPAVWARASESEYEYLDHPGGGLGEPGEPVAAPVRIPATVEELSRANRTWHVGAPGHAWSRVEVDPRRGGEYVVELSPGGSLDLVIAGPPLPRRAHVRLRRRVRGELEAVASWPLPPGAVISCDGLAPGDYVARVELGDWFEVVAIGSVGFRIDAGTRVDARLEYEAAPKPDAVPFAGEIRVPEGWDPADVKLRAELLDIPLLGQRTPLIVLRPGQGLEPVAGRPRVLRFDLGTVQVGHYDFGFPASFYHVGVDIGPGGDLHRVIELPPPAEVRIDVEGDEGGSEPFLSRIAWHYEMPRGYHVIELRSIRRESPRDPFVFRAPAGRIFVSTEGSAYHAEPLRLDVAAPATRATLRVKRNHEIRIRVVDGDQPVAWEPSWDDSLLSLDGGLLVSVQEEKGVVRMMVDRPGRYRLKVPPIEGYLPVPPREVVVKDDGPTTVRVDLIRR